MNARTVPPADDDAGLQPQRRVVAAGTLPPPRTSGARSVFDNGASAAGDALDLSQVEIRTDVPLPTAVSARSAQFDALLARMPVGASVVLPEKVARGLVARAKRSGVPVAIRPQGAGQAGVWRLAQPVGGKGGRRPASPQPRQEG
jgi:hypothetical protein